MTLPRLEDERSGSWRSRVEAVVDSTSSALRTYAPSAVRLNRRFHPVPLTLHNTLTRRKEEFRPLDPARVRMYVCGPTVYNLAHIGNARPVIVFDLLFRLLRLAYGAVHVVYARNITDVDDKIIAAAQASGETIRAVTERTGRIYQEDMAALNT